MNNKQAILIIAHNQFEIVEKILELLDHERIDFFIHIDKKAKNVNFDRLKSKVAKSDIHFVKRINVKWGNYSLINCELLLLEEAVKHDKYQYYHLISGVDFPIKSVEYILSFFDKNNGTEFVHFFHDGECNKNILQRVDKYQIVTSKNDKFIGIINKYLLYFQKKLKISRTSKCKLKFSYGANWFSITNDLVTYILENKKKIKKHFNWTSCADELFLQTLVYNSSFYEKTYFRKYNLNDDDYHQIFRYIDWNRGNPYIWKVADYNELIDSDYLFARKFDLYQDEKIIDYLYSYIKNE